MAERVDAALRDNISLAGTTVNWGHLLLTLLAVISAVSCKPEDDDKKAADTSASIKNPYGLITDKELSECQGKFEEVLEKSESGSFTSQATTTHGVSIPAVEIKYRLIRSDKSTAATSILKRVFCNAPSVLKSRLHWLTTRFRKAFLLSDFVFVYTTVRSLL